MKISHQSSIPLCYQQKSLRHQWMPVDTKQSLGSVSLPPTWNMLAAIKPDNICWAVCASAVPVFELVAYPCLNLWINRSSVCHEGRGGEQIECKFRPENSLQRHILHVCQHRHKHSLIQYLATSCGLHQVQTDPNCRLRTQAKVLRGPY